MNLSFADNSDTSSQKKEPETVVFSRIEMPRESIPNFQDCNGTPPDAKEEPVLKEKRLSEMGWNSNDVEGWEQIVQPVKPNLYELMRFMITNNLKPNVKIRIGSIVFNCHMMVLQCYSAFFSEFSQEELIQLPEEKVTPSAFKMIYKWMLADKPLVQRDSIVELLVAANFLSIKSLVNKCWLCINDDVYFREDTAFMLYLEARMYNLPALEELMLTRVFKFFLTLVSSSDFLALKTSELCLLLNLNSIGVNSEIEIFMSVVRWLDHDWETRQTDMLTLINCVRFNLMPAWFLLTLKKPNDSVEINRITAHPEVKKIIEEGIYYTTSQMVFGVNREKFLHFIESNGLAAPIQREWIYDNGCTYHRHLDCDTTKEFTYTTFLQYLDMIQSKGKNYWQNLEFAKGNEMCAQYAQCIRSSGGTKPIQSKFLM